MKVHCIQVGHNYEPHDYIENVCMNPVLAESASLSDCVNWETDEYGNCSGRLMIQRGLIVCERCFNTRHFFNLAENDPNKSNCGAKGGLIRETGTNVNCPKCLALLRRGPVMIEDVFSDDDPVREQVVSLVNELADTLSDPTQAWDIAVADFNTAIENLTK